jgi:hypothetical protein
MFAETRRASDNFLAFSSGEGGPHEGVVDEEDIITPNKKQKKQTKYIILEEKNNGRQIYGRS